jgi:hypothetical protein
MNTHFAIDGQEFFVRLPTTDEAASAQAAHDAVLQETIETGALRVDDVVPYMLANGLWDDVKNARLQFLEAAMERISAEILWWVGKTLPTYIEAGLATQAARLAEFEREREILIRLWAQLSRDTAEAYAQRTQFHSLMSFCIRHEDGSAVFKDSQGYLQRIDEPISIAAADQLSRFLDLPVTQYNLIVKHHVRI